MERPSLTGASAAENIEKRLQRRQPAFVAGDTLLKMYRKHPGAKTVADCEPLTPRERAGLETYDRLHPSKFRKIWINVKVDGVRTKDGLTRRSYARLRVGPS
jgi:hypothetical protein